MPFRQITDFSQKIKQNKIELVARPEGVQEGTHKGVYEGVQEGIQEGVQE